ncbi:45710_t:CDS:2 [Gigaspora margarita]|uniref:45710_t:CDS:1 n=1 Tax=Gigaspora margarita TaxID=4874 RepID=A0ABN7V1H9_GIGMA|nr:45710_t:CDS:2 [Gigaspora margarita]
MLLSQPKIPEVGSEFPTVESLKEAAQQGAKVAGFAFSVLSSKMLCSRKEHGTEDIVNKYNKIRNALNKGSNNNTTMQLLQKLEECNYIVCHLLSIDVIFGNAKSLNTYQIAMAWVENEKEHTYEWFLNTLKEVGYNAYFCSLEIFVSNRSQALQNAANKKKDSEYWMHINTKNYPHMGVQLNTMSRKKL